MLEKIEKLLEKAQPENVKLYFVERKKDLSTKEIKYNTFKTEISVGIGKSLIEGGKQQIAGILEDEPEYKEYGILPYSDRTLVEFISKKEVPYLPQIILDVSSPNSNIITEKDFKKVYGYIVKIEEKGATIFLFRKYTPKKLLEKGKITALFYGDEGKFKKIEENVIALDSIYDAALMLQGTSGGEENVFIFNRSKFESMFSFVDVYQGELAQKKEYLKEKEFLEDAEEFIKYCIDDARKLKKFARILKSGQLDKMDTDKIKKVSEDYYLDVEFDEQGKLKVTKDNIWIILRIFDDDYLHSDVTDTKYESRSKVKR